MAYRTWEVRPREGAPTAFGYSWYVVEINPKKRRIGPASVYGFGTKEEADAYAGRMRQKDEERELVKAQRRAARAAERKAVPNLFKVGMILENSWGYDQTNVDYYEVVRVTPRGVYVRRIGCKSVVGSGGFMCDRVVPNRGNFIGPEEFKPILPGSENGYLAADHGCMKLVEEWDATYRSWYA